MKKLFFVLFFTMYTLLLSAQSISFDIAAPRIVAVDKVFRIEFILNEIPSDYSIPPFSDFNVLAGPTTSKGQSTTVVNGNITRSVNFTITYVLQAKAVGKFTIPQATANVGGKSYNSKPITIEVISESDAKSPQQALAQNQAQNQNKSQNSSRQRATTPKSQGIGANDILIKANVNRSSVYKGQPIVVTFNLYTRVRVGGIEEIKVPSFNGFWTQELSRGNGAPQSEVVNGKVYDSYNLGQYLLFPQQSGELSIEQLSLTAVAQIVSQNTRQSVFDDLFGGGANILEVRKRINSQPVRITVKDFPAGAPASFNGAVGNFSIKGSLSSADIGANSGANYTVTISGTGNLPLIQSPKLNLPSSFEQYNVKTTESLSTTASGSTGYRQFEYPFIARAEGRYTIDPLEFTYFNPETMKYMTIKTNMELLEVRADSTGRSNGGGMVSGISKEELKILGKDIRFINIHSSRVFKKGNIFAGSWTYFSIVALLLTLFFAAFVWLQKRIKQMRNASLMRGKRANKVVRQRFRQAENFMKHNDQRHFYDELLKAMWGYMGDKLNIPVANLTKENLREELSRRDISSDIIERFLNTISECEYAQYSPETTDQMSDMFNSAVESITKFESVIKK